MGRDLKEPIGFDSPEKATGEIGFGDLISGLAVWDFTGAGEGVWYLACTGDF